MFIVVLKLPPKKLRWAAAAGVLLLALLGAFLLQRGSVAANAGMDDPNIALCRNLLRTFGWTVDDSPIETATFPLSNQLSESYLALQQEAGFDLRDDLGAQITRYTFRVTNYPTGETDVLADVLVRGNSVIGGDIRTSDMAGFMHSLMMPN